MLSVLTKQSKLSGLFLARHRTLFITTKIVLMHTRLFYEDIDTNYAMSLIEP